MEEVSFKLQHDLNMLAERHSKKNKYNNKHTLDEFFDSSMQKDLRKFAEETPVYIIINAIFDTEPYICKPPFSFRSIEYMLSETLLSKYPFLKKYPKWYNIFEQCNTNFYILSSPASDRWLSKKLDKYRITSGLY